MFDNDRATRDALTYRIAVIGEATRGLSQAFRDANPNVPWQQMTRMRNVLIHAYFGIDYDIVWSVATNELPALAKFCRSVLQHP